MKLKPRFIYLVLSLVLLAACENNVYKKWDGKSFPDYIWETEKQIVFEPEIEDTDQTYRIILGLRHVYGLRLENIPVKVEITSPSGTVDVKDYTIVLIDKDGKTLADCSGSLCDIETEVESSFEFLEKGKYTFTITQNTPYSKLNGVMEVGLIVRYQ